MTGRKDLMDLDTVLGVLVFFSPWFMFLLILSGSGIGRWVLPVRYYTCFA